MSNAVDFEEIKARQHRTWSAGDYSVIGTSLQISGEMLCEAADVVAGERVLDVATGNGNAALAAARRGADVTATDYVVPLLERAHARANAENLTIDLREADAEALPFAAASFDVVLSTFGVMFAPRQELAASELLRVCRPGGRIGLASWTPDSFVGQMFRVVSRYAAPPAGIRSPFEWGSESRLQELFGERAALVGHRREFVFRYRSARHWLDTFRDYYGPTHNAFGALDDAGRISLEHDLLALAGVHNTADAALRVPSHYLEVVVIPEPRGERTQWNPL